MARTVLGPVPGSSASRRRNLFRDVAAVGLIGAVPLLLSLGYVGLDQAYSLVWGSEILNGQLPSYDGPLIIPTPHPLATALGAVASVLGPGGAEKLLIVLTSLAFAVSTWAIVLIGRELAGWGAGAVAGVAFGTSGILLERTMYASGDLHVVAFVTVAVLVETRKPRAGAPVLGLLTLAGLQRPEAWVLAGLYWLWLAPQLSLRARVLTALMTASAPLLWTLGDLIITGDPLFSLIETRSATVDVKTAAGAAAHGDRDPGGLWGTATVVYEALRDILRLPVGVGAVIGIALAVTVGLRRVAPALGALFAWLTVVVILALGGLAIDYRFLFPVAGILAVFFGVAGLGWLRASSGRLRMGWAAIGVLLLAYLAVSVPDRVREVQFIEGYLDRKSAAVDDLGRLLQRRSSQDVIAGCGVTFVPNARLVPYASFSGDRPLSRVRILPNSPPSRGTFIAAASPTASREILEDVRGGTQPPLPPPREFTRRTANASWLLLARGC